MMIVMWLVGDAVKLAFLIMQKQPMQFLCGTGFVIVVELLILGQFWYYGSQRKV